MAQDMDSITNFLLQMDGLKSVNRKSYINGGERVENSAEHSWHLAMACWAFAQLLEDDYDIEKLIKLALVHDLGEIDAGDTFLYGKERNNAHIKERECVARIASHPGNPISNLTELWEEQETGLSKETKLLKAVDRLLPFLHNMTSEGRAWKENKIHAKQVRAAHAFIKDEHPAIHQWFSDKVDIAIKKGWLDNS
ncbi:MAG: HD domain-containing protein [Pseudohongiellaceae bacterium]|nr:HD domain-containing protein [Pseudohongiellaceae bacterium]